MNIERRITTNLDKVRWEYALPALVGFLGLIGYFLIASAGTSFAQPYIAAQAGLFHRINHFFSGYPALEFNLTQLGDAFFLFPFLGLFAVYAPRLWEAVLTTSLLNLIVSATLKKIFAVPRPAAVFDQSGFTIVGKTLTGSNSFPSGHSITISMILCILLFAFMPRRSFLKILWSVLITVLIAGIGFSRVVVGAHYPLDVIGGCLTGMVLAVVGIVLSKRYPWLSYFKSRYGMFILLTIVVLWFILMARQVLITGLPVGFVAMGVLLATFILIVRSYAQKS